ncbi:hypothetical protein QMK19_19695 [Streptomyces sp. H10-C2]|uniref:hypothetical protein n=1 Tax=unclassified Streptomyces TaxID=2593676 RepID=UPI0024BBE15E|nr:MULTISPECIES: hypothetical protein [unclassified Streptomyces]MDJ0343351.1 hypothetical protein [Streptomyces sp. PH10-H1]MDJ0371838.1 hypothetical protein [Streptomyces sp. H10-C2]
MTDFLWPRLAEADDTTALEAWLDARGWEIDPTIFMAGTAGPAVQVRRIGTNWQDGEDGLLILPGESVTFDAWRMCVVPKPGAGILCRSF